MSTVFFIENGEKNLSAATALQKPIKLPTSKESAPEPQMKRAMDRDQIAATRTCAGSEQGKSGYAAPSPKQKKRCAERATLTTIRQNNTHLNFQTVALTSLRRGYSTDST